jgi:hypothetical protein
LGEAIIPKQDLDKFEDNLKKSFSKYLQVRKGKQDLTWEFLYLEDCELYCSVDMDEGNVIVVTVVLSDIEKSDINEINTYLKETEFYETWFATQQEDGLTQIIYAHSIPMEKVSEVKDIETEFSIVASNSNNFLTLNLQKTFGGSTSYISNIPWHKYFKHTIDEDLLNKLGIRKQ